MTETFSLEWAADGYERVVSGEVWFRPVLKVVITGSSSRCAGL
jgi:hypothetical protein